VATGLAAECHQQPCGQQAGPLPAASHMRVGSASCDMVMPAKTQQLQDHPLVGLSSTLCPAPAARLSCQPLHLPLAEHWLAGQQVLGSTIAAAVMSLTKSLTLESGQCSRARQLLQDRQGRPALHAAASSKSQTSPCFAPDPWMQEILEGSASSKIGHCRSNELHGHSNEESRQKATAMT